MMKTLEQQPEQTLQPRHFLEAENVWVETGSNIMAYGIVVKETMAQSEDEKVEVIIRISDDEDDDVDFDSRFFKAGDIYQMSSQDCPRCGNTLYIEHHKDIDYPYYCPHCQENFYQMEI